MTRVEFYFNVADKLAKSAALCEKAVNKGRQLTLLTQDEQMNTALQQYLWQHSATSFLANAKATEAHSAFSAIVLDCSGENLQQDDVLINLQGQQPPFFSRFRHLVEIVGKDEEDRLSARQRFKFYKDRGYAIKATDEITGEVKDWK
ncbi:MAG TPA: DNA polymerase III subunit chi [Methylotenera sp.]|nr:DNA polymerase III subunit chi [Methylotenera sp.]